MAEKEEDVVDAVAEDDNERSDPLGKGGGAGCEHNRLTPRALKAPVFQLLESTSLLKPLVSNVNLPAPPYNRGSQTTSSSTTTTTMTWESPRTWTTR